jgi:hypothetical protein
MPVKNKKLPVKIPVNMRGVLLGVILVLFSTVGAWLYIETRSKDNVSSAGRTADRSDCFTYDQNSDDAVNDFIDAYNDAADASLKVYVGCGESPMAGLIVTQHHLSATNGKLKSTQFSYAAASQPSAKEHYNCSLEIVGRKNAIARCGPDAFNIFSTQQ